MENIHNFISLNTFPQNAPPGSSFANRNTREVVCHFKRSKYGKFFLPQAIRPSFDLQIIPQEGYRHKKYLDEITEKTFPMLCAAISEERLMNVCFEMLDILGSTANVVLETSHPGILKQKNFHYYFREEIDIPVLKSILLDYEELLLGDGCMSLAIIDNRHFQEIHLDEHKLLIIYTENPEYFQQILHNHAIYALPNLSFITDAEHVHVTRDKYFEVFQQLAYDLCMEAF
ncbi:MAG: hypothetical protein Q4C96_08960 [Planctomycetia bacterium]|nr:hypothetical protein [Planctomycetia bacterium]